MADGIIRHSIGFESNDSLDLWVHSKLIQGPKLSVALIECGPHRKGGKKRMRRQYNLVCFALGSVLLYSIAIFITNLQAQPPRQRVVVFVSNRDGNDEIYVMNSNGSTPRRLTENNKRDLAPVWHPSGNRIAFTSTRDGGMRSM